MYEFLEKLKKWMIITFVGCGGALALIAFIGGFSVYSIKNFHSGLIHSYSLYVGQGNYWYSPHYGLDTYDAYYYNFLWEIRALVPMILFAFVAVALVLFVVWLLVKRPKPLVSLIRITIIAIIALIVWDLLIWAIPYLVREIILLFY